MAPMSTACLIPSSVAPDYRGGSLLNLIASCVAACGGRALHPTLDALAQIDLSAARNVVLVIVDGLGYNYLASRGAGSALAARAAEWLDGKADVLPGRALLDAGWFGAGDRHPRLADRIGDFALVMRERYTVKDWLPGEPKHLHIGNHGGLSADEMYTPLVYASI